MMMMMMMLMMMIMMMTIISGLTMHYQHQSMGNEQLMGSEGPGKMPHRPRDWGIRLSDQEWSPGPE
eukprot:947176-Karenia_brevis.AAC.1